MRDKFVYIKLIKHSNALDDPPNFEKSEKNSHCTSHFYVLNKLFHYESLTNHDKFISYEELPNL